ncbi:MAG: flagellar basal body L-ring protein FlgH [Acidobacteriota bacterium]
MNRRCGKHLEWRLAVAGVVVTLLVPGGAFARKKKDRHVSFQQSLAEYVRQAEQGVANPAPTTGSIWNPNGPLAQLPRDDKAYRLGDILTINISEETTAQATGTVKSSRDFSASSSISALLGEIGPTSGLQNIFSPNSSKALNGQAQTASTSSLTTSLAATVVAVMPNNYMVVQAMRTVKMDNQLQQVILRGIVRPSDIAPDNSVPSMALADLSVQVNGKGVINDSTRPPNWLVRQILKIVGF